MVSRKPIALFSEWLFKISLVVYFLYLMFPGEYFDLFCMDFWREILNILYFLLWIVIALIVTLPSQRVFRIISFFLLGISSFFKLLLILYNDGIQGKMSVFILLFFISFYELTRIYLYHKSKK